VFLVLVQLASILAAAIPRMSDERPKVNFIIDGFLENIKVKGLCSINV
jgi:hypothetical protein